MAEEILSELGEVNLTTGPNEIPALAYGETGYNGLIVLGGDILEECQEELRFPEALNTYKKMAKDGAIAPALEMVERMIADVPWSVKIPEGYEEKLKDKAQFLIQNMNDMDHSWNSFIQQVVSFNRYGFSVHEKVYRYRKKDQGSKYDDNLIGIRRLPIRTQDSIQGWVWGSQGRDIKGFNQYVNKIQNEDYVGWDYVATGGKTNNGENIKFIPRKKYLHFLNSKLKDNPWGASPLNGCWKSWKYKSAMEEAEAIGVAQDSNGFKVLYLPPQYLKEDATPEDKQVLEYYKKMMANAHVAKQSGVILPYFTDSQGNKQFEFEIKSITGQKSFDTNAIIQRYTMEILTCLFADFLSLGNSGGGSFSLAESKLSLVEMVIKSKLTEIADVLNHDLIPQLFALNGWDVDVVPYFAFGKPSKESLDEISKFIQRVRAVGMLPRTPEVVNWALESADIDYKVPKDTSAEELAEMCSSENDQSRSGDGLASSSGGLNGTGNSAGSRDNSTANNANA
ncbi:hypothetical protein D3C87_324010 [compost metagenome]